jgi:protease-4
VLGAACDEVLIQAGGAVSLPGMYMEEMFLADTLRWAGVTPDYVQIGDYKGASEMMANSAPSPKWDQNINGLLDGLYGAMRDELKSGRGLTDDQLDAAMKDLAFADAKDAIRHGLVDVEIDRPALDEHLESVYGEDWAVDSAMSGRDKKSDMANMGLFEAFQQIMQSMEGADRATTRETIAILHIDGPIMDGKSGGGGVLGGGPSVGALTIREALKKIEDDENIKGLIVRVNSPGGSAIASENIWQGVRRVAEKKMVWTSVGTMAASGGYYIAVAGEKIYVNPSSIVGSIGVVGGKLAMHGLYEKAKINVVPRTRGPMASLMGSYDVWTPEQREYIKRVMTQTYDQFVGRVTQGRKGIDIAKTAEGRLFTGQKAIDLKMADKMGGIDSAIGDMADALDLGAGAFDVLDFPAPMSLEDMLGSALPMAGGASGELPATLAALRELVGQASFDQIAASVSALLQLRKEPVVLVSPSVLIVR